MNGYERKNMFAIPAVVDTPTAMALQPSVLAASASVNVATTRQTAAAPAATLPNVSVGDNNGGGSSAQYLAQSIAQEDTTVEIATQDEEVAPAPEYNVFVSYGFIKYKPSDAGIPSQLKLPLSSTSDDAAAANEYQAYSNTQSRNQSNIYPQATHVALAG